MRKIKEKWALASRRAVAILLLMAASSLAIGACAGSGSEWWRERPSSENYMRLPVR